MVKIQFSALADKTLTSPIHKISCSVAEKTRLYLCIIIGSFKLIRILYIIFKCTERVQELIGK